MEAGEQVELLRRHRCDVMQGFLFCPPLPEEDVTRLLLGGDRPSERAMPGRHG